MIIIASLRRLLLNVSKFESKRQTYENLKTLTNVFQVNNETITAIISESLIDWCFTARQHKIGQFVPIYQGGLLAQAFEDSQRGTYKTIQLNAIQ